jgi:dCTP deaminase
MSVLSDSKIKRHQAHDLNFDIEPYDESCVQPASYDLHLGNEFGTIAEDGVIDLHGSDPEIDVWEAESITLDPWGSVLGTTVETVTVPPEFVGVVTGRSSLGRLFVTVHVTAGYVDSGFEGEITLEIVNNGSNPVKLHAGDRVAQMYWVKTMGEVEHPYGERGHYNGQTGATGPQMNFE